MRGTDEWDEGGGMDGRDVRWAWTGKEGMEGRALTGAMGEEHGHVG